ncbi:MAG: hypothetical protein F4Y26_06930 [Gammaproteobacteria bacterium]|nr:hypothetical protein [Gammaproteobacteria bacterium]
MFAAARDEVGDVVYEPFVFADLNDQEFLGEYCWVVFASGFRYTVVRDRFPAIRDLFQSFDLKSLADMAPVERDRLPIRNKRKADGFLAGCRMIAEEGFDAFKARLSEEGGVEVLEQLPGIGPITKHHLAKNIGLKDTAKPDVWLARCAEACGAADGHELVAFLHEAHPSFKKQQIDTILWDCCQRLQGLPPMAAAGVYAIEGAWPTPEFMPASEMLRVWTRANGASLAVESAAPREELLGHLRSWSEADASYGVLYLRFPRSGRDGLLLDGIGGAGVSLEDIASSIEQAVYGSENCIVHLGPCWPRSATTKDIERFLERTGFAAVSGYASEVGWAESLAFDLLYLERLADVAVGGWLRPEVAAGCRDLLDGARHGPLSRSLGFRLVVAGA